MKKIIILICVCLFSSTSIANDLYGVDLDSNIRVVSLGDPTHFEGTINRHRANFINQLITKNGFNVVLFESNIYEVNIAFNRYLESKNKEDIFEGMFWMFKSEGVLELFKNIEKQLNQGKDIRIGGFDSKFSGNNTFQYLKKDLENQDYIFSKIKKTDKESFYLILQKLISKSRTDSKMDEEELIKFEKIIDVLIQEFKPKNYNENILKQCLMNMKSECDRLKYVGIKNMNKRDLQMSKNVMYLLQNHHNKIILWGSSTHFIKKSEMIDSHFHKKRNYKPLGSYLDQNLKDQYFYIAYSSLSGEKTNLLYKSKIKIPKKNSVGYEIWVNMNENNTKEILVKTSRYKGRLMNCRILGHHYYKMYINEVSDGIFFLKNTQPFSVIE